jgi:ribosomal protein S18 acetylase RimI-like enzyme
MLCDEDVFCERLRLHDPDTLILTETCDGLCAGFAVVRKNAVMLLAVDIPYRRQGIGGRLLKRAEEHILKEYDNVVLGVADGDYLYPGVPLNSFESFFEKNGFVAERRVVDMMIDKIKLPDGVTEIDPNRIDDPDYLRFIVPQWFSMPAYGDNKPYYDVSGDIIFRFRGNSLSERQAAKICGDRIEDGWGDIYAESDCLVIAFDTKTNAIIGGVSVEDDCAYNLTYPTAGSIGCVGVLSEYRKMGIGMRLCREALKRFIYPTLKPCFIGYTGLESWYSQLGAYTITEYRAT